MAKKKEAEGMKNIKFLLSPTGAFGLGYNAGDVASIDEKQADELVNAGYAQFVIDGGVVSVQTEAEKLKAENDQLKEVNKAQFEEIEMLKKAANEKGIQHEVPAGAVDGLTLQKITSAEVLKEGSEDKNTGHVTKAGEETVIAGEGNNPDVKITKAAETPSEQK